jgi:acyl-CoA hydrolase
LIFVSEYASTEKTNPAVEKAPISLREKLVLFIFILDFGKSSKKIKIRRRQLKAKGNALQTFTEFLFIYLEWCAF